MGRKIKIYYLKCVSLRVYNYENYFLKTLQLHCLIFKWVGILKFINLNEYHKIIIILKKIINIFFKN